MPARVGVAAELSRRKQLYRRVLTQRPSCHPAAAVTSCHGPGDAAVCKAAPPLVYPTPEREVVLQAGLTASYKQNIQLRSIEEKFTKWV